MHTYNNINHKLSEGVPNGEMASVASSAGPYQTNVFNSVWSAGGSGNTGEGRFDE